MEKSREETLRQAYRNSMIIGMAAIGARFGKKTSIWTATNSNKVAIESLIDRHNPDIIKNGLIVVESAEDKDTGTPEYEFVSFDESGIVGMDVFNSLKGKTGMI